MLWEIWDDDDLFGHELCFNFLLFRFFFSRSVWFTAIVFYVHKNVNLHNNESRGLAGECLVLGRWLIQENKKPENND